MSSTVHDLLNALPTQIAIRNVSLLDALPDPNEFSSITDYESKPSLLVSNPSAMSAAAEFAVMSHLKSQEEVIMPVSRKRARVQDAMSKKKQKLKNRGKEIKTRNRGNQRQ
jgi:hypothetical protein